MSLWRKRKSCDNIAPNVVANVHYSEQKPDHLVNIVTNLSIKSKDLSMQLKMWVDPPEGWKFGFPAIFDPVKDGNMRDWIISKGYPKQIIQEYGDVWFVRCWSAEEVKPSDEFDCSFLHLIFCYPPSDKYPVRVINAQKHI